MPDIKPELRSYNNRGFHLTFQNGWTISVMFGPSTYSSNRTAIDKGGAEWKATSADVAIWDVEGKDLQLSSGISRGWTSPDKIAKLIAFVQGIQPDLRAIEFDTGELRTSLSILLASE